MKIDFLPRSKKFLGPLVDEIALHEQAGMILADGEPNIVEALSCFELDLATSVLYNYIRQSKHANFISDIDKLPTRTIPNQKNINILIIPGMFYLEYPDVGADGQLAKTIFEKNGFHAKIISVKSRGSVAENKEVILREIQLHGQADLWLLSISKGTADVRACLQDLPSNEFPSNLKGWINFSGIYAGSILADHRTSTSLKRLFLRTLCKLAGVNYKLVQELSTAHEYWRQKSEFTSKLKLIHVVGFPLKSHVQPLLSRRYTALSKLGPTDGMISLIDTANYPGHVYPIWGCDHFARSANVSALLYRLCHYIAKSPIKDVHQ